MNSKQQRPLKKLLGIRGMGAALTAFVGLIIIYIAFGIINPAVFSIYCSGASSEAVAETTMV